MQNYFFVGKVQLGLARHIALFERTTSLLASERSERDTLSCSSIEIVVCRGVYVCMYVFIWYVRLLFARASNYGILVKRHFPNGAFNL